jgi:hypothetical protein
MVKFSKLKTLIKPAISFQFENSRILTVAEKITPPNPQSPAPLSDLEASKAGLDALYFSGRNFRPGRFSPFQLLSRPLDQSSLKRPLFSDGLT